MIEVVTFSSKKTKLKDELKLALKAEKKGVGFSLKANSVKISIEKTPTWSNGENSITVLKVNSIEETEVIKHIEILATIESGTGNVWDEVFADPAKKAKLESARVRELVPVYNNEEPYEQIGEDWNMPEYPGGFA